MAETDNDCISEPTTKRQQREQPREQQAAGSGASGTTSKHKKGTKKRANKTPCTFFPRGRCRYGDGCRFSHDVVREFGEEGQEEGQEEEEDSLASKEAALDTAEKAQVRWSVRIACGCSCNSYQSDVSHFT